MLGIYDSGLGGLCALRRVRELLPSEDIVYLADTAHLPYGTKGTEIIESLARRAIRRLIFEGADAVLCACGTVSSTVLPSLRDGMPVPLVGVAEPSAAAAVKTTKNCTIGVLGTSATVHSGAFPRLINRRLAGAEVISRACDMFVPIVESGFSENEAVCTEVARVYLDGLERCDTVILGCTHFPHLARYIRRILPSATLIDSAREGAEAMLPYAAGGGGRERFLATDISPAFRTAAERFLGEKIKDIEKIKI